MSAARPLPLYTVDEYLRLERAALERHEYVDGRIYAKSLMPLRFPLYTVEEYLELERSSLDRHEYLDGHIYLMAGESPRHGFTSANLMGIFYHQLKGTLCFAMTKD